MKQGDLYIRIKFIFNGVYNKYIICFNLYISKINDF